LGSKNRRRLLGRAGASPFFAPVPQIAIRAAIGGAGGDALIEVWLILKYQSNVCFVFLLLSAFACVKYGSEHQHNNIIEWYKLSNLEEQDERFVVSEEILKVGVLQWGYKLVGSLDSWSMTMF
jgi:hypothetical protein